MVRTQHGQGGRRERGSPGRARLPSPSVLSGGQHSRVHVGEQARLVEHRRRGLNRVAEGRLVAQSPQLRRCLRVLLRGCAM